MGLCWWRQGRSEKGFLGGLGTLCVWFKDNIYGVYGKLRRSWRDKEYVFDLLPEAFQRGGVVDESNVGGFFWCDRYLIEFVDCVLRKYL